MAVLSRLSNRVLVGLAFISLSYSLPAAAAMSAEDGKRLKDLFGGMVDHYRNEARLQGGDLLVEGEVMVEPGDNYFAITLPHLTSLSADGTKINIGLIAINAVPGNQPQEWKMTLAMPTPITMYDASGKESAVLEIGSQNFAGVFHESFKNFVRLNAQYKNISFYDPVDGAKITIPDARAVYDLKQGGNALWSGPMNLSASNIQATFGNTGAAGKIASIRLDSTIKDYSIEAANAYNEKMEALIESLDTDRPSDSTSHFMGMYNTVFDFLTTVWDGFGSDFTISGAEFITPAAGDKPASTIKIGKAGFGFMAEGLKSNQVMLRPTVTLSGLSITPPPAGFDQLAPDSFNLDLTLNNLPLTKLSDLGKKSLEQSSQSPESGGLVMQNTVAMAQKLLTDAGASLKIVNTGASKADEYSVLLNGSAAANIQALLGGTAKLRVEIFGLETILSSLQTLANDPAVSAENKQSAANALQVLTLLQMIGQQGTNGNGQPTRTYDVEITPDGKQLLNGADMMTVMGGAAQ
ncbi:MAG: hypothetical protein HYS17_04855 [Micavibrio aeruginosavorus]|uniref:DUF2125 domain-containing protein n=1 Tax=Micavibrio aeruginosavorus TaxID=349221 RepID=A0A7T5R3Y8_9BACT|nr:MAG: hypothetical protein HYS17_04855 [Micavibrio aeruginosavorus]